MYTLIAYRPDYHSYRDGEHSSSDHMISEYEDDEITHLIESMVWFLSRNADLGSSYSNWELTLLINGRTVLMSDDTIDYELDKRADIDARVQEILEKNLEEKKKKAEEARKKQEKIVAERTVELQRKARHAQYLKLQKEFG